MTERDKLIFILAGPNGAGKTTFAREYLPIEAQCLTFINADLIALGLSPFRPEQAALRAGRLMLELIEQHVARGESFAFETTLAGRNFARTIPNWREQGYTVTIFFLALPSVEHALERVAGVFARVGTRSQTMRFCGGSSRDCKTSSGPTRPLWTSGFCWTIPVLSPLL